MPKRPWTFEDEARLLALHARGLSWLRISRDLHRSEASVVGRYLKLTERKTCDNLSERVRVADNSDKAGSADECRPDHTVQPVRQTIARKPKLRLPFRDPVLRRAEAAIADNRRLREQLIENRWKAAALESRLLDLRENLAGERHRGELTIRAAVSTSIAIGLLTGIDPKTLLRWDRRTGSSDDVA